MRKSESMAMGRVRRAQVWEGGEGVAMVPGAAQGRASEDMTWHDVIYMYADMM